jgi:hypothetical protein
MEDNPEYIALMAEESALSRALDSISMEMSRVRGSFRTDTLNREANTVAILQMEEKMFEMRNDMARLAGRINVIEQEWIMKSFEDGVAETTEPDTLESPMAETLLANLVYNKYFELNLSPEQLDELRQAQDSEREIGALTVAYIDRHLSLRELSAQYDSVATQSVADSLKADFDVVTNESVAIDELIARQWGAIFDSKSYVYNYLMDKENNSELLEKYEAGMERTRQAQARWQGVYASDAIVNYILQKRLITDCEIALAEDMHNAPALDSLRQVRKAIPDVRELELAPVSLRERLFLDYSDIAIGESPYDARNPIPEVKVYPKGVIYRVLLGAFSSPQQPSVFKGVSPLAVCKFDDGKFRYFAGGFATDSTANVAVESMRERGFKAPQAVVWMDGLYFNPADTEESDSRFFRVELSGVDELTDGVREVVGTVAGDKPIVHGEGMFIVGPLDDALTATRLRTALDGLDPDMDVTIAEILPE